MEQKRIIILLMLFVLAILVSLQFDSEIVKEISYFRINLLNEFFLGITFIGSKIIILFFLTSLFLWREHKRKWILPLWITFALSGILSFLMKLLVQRQRPFQLGIVSLLPILENANHLLWNFSFPSSHAMLVFCTVPILSKEFPKFKYWWIAFAGLIAFSRIYFGLHFLSDVLVGGLVGYLIGIAVIKLEIKTKFSEKIYKNVFKK